jgi:hypothetical protein
MSKARTNHSTVLSGAAANQFKQPLAKFREAMEARRELWQRLTPEQRRHAVRQRTECAGWGWCPSLRPSASWRLWE